MIRPALPRKDDLFYAGTFFIAEFVYMTIDGL